MRVHGPHNSVRTKLRCIYFKQLRAIVSPHEYKSILESDEPQPQKIVVLATSQRVYLLEPVFMILWEPGLAEVALW